MNSSVSSLEIQEASGIYGVMGQIVSAAIWLYIIVCVWRNGDCYNRSCMTRFWELNRNNPLMAQFHYCDDFSHPNPVTWILVYFSLLIFPCFQFYQRGNDGTVTAYIYVATLKPLQIDEDANFYFFSSKLHVFHQPLHPTCFLSLVSYIQYY